MRKGKLTRVTAAALTLAMAFTLLAVPASAAVNNMEAAFVTAIIADDASVLIEVPEAAEDASDAQDKETLVDTATVEDDAAAEEAEDETPVPASADDDKVHAADYIAEFVDAVEIEGVNFVFAQTAYQKTNDSGKDEALADSAWQALVVEKGAYDNVSIYTGPLPSETVAGLQNQETKEIVWLSKDNVIAITKATDDAELTIDSIDWKLGVITIGDTEIQTRSYTGNAQVGPKANLIVGGAVVAGTAVAAYLISNPGIWQRTADAVQNILNQITGKTASAA